MMRSKRGAARWGCSTAIALLAALLGPAAAWAHTSYLMPNLFKTADAAIVTAQAAFTEDFPRAEVGLQTTTWQVVKPDGSAGAFKRVEAFEQLTILEAALDQAGTYRLTTGERLGRAGQQVFMGGEWIPMEPGQQIPAGTQTRPSQTVTVADVYVTKGAPTMRAIEANTSRLQLRPTTHPNAVTLASGFRFRVTLDGRPVAGAAVSIQREGGGYETPRYDRIVRANEQGEVILTFDRPGAYLLMTRLSADAPAGSQTAIRSYTTSLTLEVTT